METVSNKSVAIFFFFFLQSSNKDDKGSCSIMFSSLQLFSAAEGSTWCVLSLCSRVPDQPSNTSNRPPYSRLVPGCWHSDNQRGKLRRVSRYNETMSWIVFLRPVECKFLMFFFSPSTVEKMKMIDKEYESFNYSGDRYFSFQSKLAAYRKEIEAQVQAEMNTKVHIFFHKVSESKTVAVSAIINTWKELMLYLLWLNCWLMASTFWRFFFPKDGTF